MIYISGLGVKGQVAKGSNGCLGFSVQTSLRTKLPTFAHYL